MKPVLLSLVFILSAFSFSASANQNQVCYLKTEVVKDDISYLANMFNIGSMSLNDFTKKTQQGLEFSLTLASGNTPPNDYVMSMFDNASMHFNVLTQNLNTRTYLIQNINFSKLKNDFNSCLTEEVKQKCPQAISHFNNAISSFLANHSEVIREHGQLSSAKKQVFSIIRSDYENSVVMTPAKFKELSQLIQTPQQNYRFITNKTQKDLNEISSLIENDLAKCLLQ
nr:hypothetical protein BHI3_09220 [Bacteriovorax sp. HI3]